jgi:CDP-glycerol glycerophosphotransferase
MSLISVVIPAYNVEQYLRACLESLEAQSHTDLQVLIVDDESSDATPYIAQQFAERDTRFQHVRQANRGPGPGGGRNGGLPFVEGDWIYFLDGDDLVPPDALRQLVAVGDRTGSDIVTGNVARFRVGGDTWPTPNHARSHAQPLESTHILRHPILAYDTTAWNKIYRTTFWNGAGREFPERKLFEDINPITRAHCESASTDVIAEPVYLWRIRDDQTSITQQVADERTFRDKIEQMSLAHGYLVQNGYDEVRAVFEQKSLTRDFLQGVDDVADGDDAYAHMVCTEGAAFLDQMMDHSIEQLPLHDQLKFHLVREGRVDDLRACVDGAYETSSITQRRDGARLEVANDFASSLDPAVPPELTISDSQPAVLASRVYVRWDDDGLVISGTATVPGFGGVLSRLDDLQVVCNHAVHRFAVGAELQSPASGGVRGLVNMVQLDRSRRSGRLAPLGRFIARIPFAELAPPDGADIVQWTFSLRGETQGLVRVTPLPVLSDDRLPTERTTAHGDFTFELGSVGQVTVTGRRMS